MLVFIGLDSWLGRCSAECGKSYRSFSVAESHRTAQGPRQRTLLTLAPDFRRLGADPLYRVSDALLRHRDRPESRLHERERTLSGIGDTVLLYDLTSTCFEGQAAANPKARRGYSHDKRSDCKQVCVGLVLTAEGFVKAHEVFSGNTADTSTEVGSTPPPRANTGKSTTGSPSPEPSFPNDTTTPPKHPSNRTLRSD